MRILSPTICTSVWRLPRCQASRTASSALCAEISISASGAPATSTMAPSSSTRPSPSRRRHRLLEIEQEFGALLAGQHDAPPVAVAGVEHDAVAGGDRVPFAGVLDRCHAVHGDFLRLSCPRKRVSSNRRFLSYHGGRRLPGPRHRGDDSEAHGHIFYSVSTFSGVMISTLRSSTNSLPASRQAFRCGVCM